MKKIKNTFSAYKIFSIAVLIMFIASCKKEWLEEKSDITLIVPETVEDLQALLDHDQVMNGATNIANSPIPGIGEVLADNYYLLFSGSSPNYTSIPDHEKRAYTWQNDIFSEFNSTEDWIHAYRVVFYANVVLEGVEKLREKPHDAAILNSLEGSALFFRAFSFYNIAQLYAKPYDKSTASSELGIVLKLGASIDETIVRAPLDKTYQKIVDDLLKAEQLLPANVKFKTRPSRVAARALLSRVYLSMEDYENALIFADKSISDNSDLLDYNSISTTANSPFPNLNDEVLFFSILNNYRALAPQGSLVDSSLANSYQDNDLRKVLFLKASGDGYYFKGNYTGSTARFGGIANDEIYLNKAEAQARTNKVGEAMTTLNNFLITRFSNAVPYVPLTASTEHEALNIILAERRKQLLYRGLRWTDLRRLNKDERFKITLTRKLFDGTDTLTYTLPPNDPRYTVLIPKEVINQSGLPQNSR